MKKYIAMLVLFALIIANGCREDENETVKPVEKNPPVYLNVNLPENVTLSTMPRFFEKYQKELEIATGKESNENDRINVSVSENTKFSYDTEDLKKHYDAINLNNTYIDGNIYKLTVPENELTDPVALANAVSVEPKYDVSVEIEGTPTFSESNDIDFSNVNLIEQEICYKIGIVDVATTLELAGYLVPKSDVNGKVNTTMNGDVSVSYEITTKEEGLLKANGVSVSSNGEATNVLFNDDANPVTNEALEYYSDIYFEGEKFVVTAPEKPAEMGDLTMSALDNNVILEEEIQYFSKGSYTGFYDPDDGLASRMVNLNALKADASYFNCTQTKDSCSFYDVNGDYITKLVLGYEK